MEPIPENPTSARCALVGGNGVMSCAVWLCVISGMLSAGCRAPQKTSAFDFSTSLGVIFAKDGRSFLDIRNGNLPTGHRIQFVTAATPQETGEAEITGEEDTPVERMLHRYRIRIARGALPNGIPAIAVANFSGTLTEAAKGVAGDLDGDGLPESFRHCTSAEGLHLTVWTGEPLHGPRKWHSYYYLGYAVASNCTDAETEPDPQ